jgi:hypothetical protein
VAPAQILFVNPVGALPTSTPHPGLIQTAIVSPKMTPRCTKLVNFQEAIMATQDNKGGTGTRGGTPEQHAEAGRQSHKNDGNSQSGGSGGGSGGGAGGTRGGTPEQHAEAGRQSHKNDNK